MFVTDERKQLPAGRQAPGIYSMESRFVELVDVIGGFGPAHRVYGRTGILAPDYSGCPIGNDLALKIESPAAEPFSRICFGILTAAVAGNLPAGFVEATGLIRVQQQ
jgi:hypothetical protein